MSLRSFVLAALAALLIAAPAAADDVTVGKLVIHDPWARATPTGAPVAGGFMRIENTGTVPDRLVGGSLTAAGRFEVHEMRMQGDVMQMRPVEGGLVIPPGGEVVLKPGSYHVMFMDMKAQLVEGTAVAGTLTFEKAGTVDVRYAVRALAAKGDAAKTNKDSSAPPSGHSGH
jgi:copper(I)-binding protein